MASKFEGHYQITERADHDSVLIGDTLYTWGGDRHDIPGVHDSNRKRETTSHIEIYHLHTGQWSTKPTSGKPPLGVAGYSCSAVNDNIYYFGGWCGHDICYHNSLNVLNTVTATWKELQPTSDYIPVMRRGFGGMITIEFEDDGVHLLMIGGRGGPLPTVKLPNTRYVVLPSGRVRTNEHNIYSISTAKWTTPKVIGECMPTNEGFTINNINKSKAIIFGGWIGSTTTSDIYVIDITKNAVHWQCIKKSSALLQWPIKRYRHASCIIDESLPILVVIGGSGHDHKTFNDDSLWILNVNDCHWTKIDLPDLVTQRFYHSLSAFVISSHCTWLIVVGGKNANKKLIPHSDPNITMIVELVHRANQWTVGCILDSTKLGTSDYHHKLKSVLTQGKSEKYSIDTNIAVKLQDTTERLTNQLIQNEELKRQLKHKDVQLQEKELQLKKAEQTQDTYQQSNVRLLQQLQQMQVAKQDAQDQLQEKERELQQYREVVHVQHQQFQSQHDYWVVSKDDVIMTREILGEGSYGNVTVAVFRGLRVAAKCLHHLIISDYNLALFSREMDIASRIRHPNLVQFIGATKVGSPIILTELMSTSLYKELQKKFLTRPQIANIGRDVALALNYLHLWKPDPIIHRDISSPNVLLEPTVGDSYKAKVTDYGTANLQQQARTDMPGNPAYAAPESRYPDEHTPSMDVYSYSVLLMEMTLHCPPCMTVRERDIQASTIQWSPMKSLVQSGMKRDHKSRPTISRILSIIVQF